MAMLNIPTSVDDPDYRYKMPRLATKKEGKGKGIKTCIMNMSDVACALKTSPLYCVKFFGCELGAQTSYTNRKGEGERATVNGHHETMVFQDLLDKFIERYVLCQKCRLPEVDVAVKRGTIVAACRACGRNRELDSTHKVSALMLKSFLEDKKDTRDGKRNKKDRKGQKVAAEVAETSGTAGGGASEDGETDRKGSRGCGGGVREAGGASAESGEDGEGDTAEVEYGGGACASLVADVVAWSEREDSITPSALFDELRPMQAALRFDDSLRMYVALSVLFKDGAMDAAGIAAKRAHIERFTTKCALPVWMWGFDAFLDANPRAARGYPLVLKALYDEGLAEESDLLRHYRARRGGPGFEAAARAAAPFLRWLETADVDDSSDEESASGSAAS